MTTFGRAGLGIAGTVKRMVDFTWGYCGVFLVKLTVYLFPAMCSVISCWYSLKSAMVVVFTPHELANRVS